MRQKRVWTASLVLALVLALLPGGARATPPVGGNTISFGTGNDVGASADIVFSVALGDLDNDGDLDVVSGSSSDEDNEIIVWQNDGSPFSGLWTPNDVGTTDPGAAQSVALGDLDNDGDLDIVSGDSFGEVRAWKNDGTPFTGTWTSNRVGDNTWGACVALGDLDGDGDLDIVSGSSSTEDYEVSVWQNDGTPFSGTWTENNVGASDASVNSVAVGDLDDDGDLDIVSGSSEGEDYEVIAWRNDGSPFSGLWTQNDVGASDDTVYSVALGDLDGDGDLDIVSGSEWPEDYEVIAWQNDGSPFSGTWTSNDVGSDDADVFSVALGDLDGDGDLDIVAGQQAVAGTEVRGLQNDGTPFSGTWTESEVGHSDSDVHAVALGDLDNDGDLDAVTGSHSAEDYEIIACQNTLVHRNMPFDPAGSGVGTSTGNVISVALGDLDDDGDLDAVSGDSGGEIRAWRNDGTPFSGLWTPNDVGASDGTVRSVALGDLDDDGDLDVVTGSTSGEDYEVIAWRNDGTPFSGTWSQNDVGASADRVDSVALGDLDNDGDLDIASGSGLYEDYEVIVWRNDGGPFTGTWTPNDVGASTGFVNSVALGDLDGDGDLDIASASSSSEDYEVITWRNDGTPFSGLWAQDDVGATDMVHAVALGDLDDDGDLDVVSGSSTGADYEVMIWRNIGGSVTEDTTATAPAQIGEGQRDDVLRVVVTHNGIPSDNDLELTQWNLLFEESSGDPLTSAEANNLIENLYVYYSADGTWGPTDTVVTTIATLSLSAGVQTIDFTDGDSNVQIPAPTSSKTYFVVTEVTDDASSQTPNVFQITFDPDADSLVEDRAEDSSVSIEDTEPMTSTTAIGEQQGVYLPIIMKNH